MDKKQINETNKKSALLTVLGIAIMVILTATKAVPTSNIAGFSVFVGLAFFFIVEAVGKIPREESGLRFSTILNDIKKPGVMIWVLLPVASCLLTDAVGRLLFRGEFLEHVMGRTGELLTFDKVPLLAVQVVVAALGEEIAYRGFFLGKSAKIAPFWLCAAVSSAVFAAGHISAGGVGVVLFDVACVFADSQIFSVIYRKTGNCAVCTVAHILGNATGIVVGMMGLS